MKCLRMVKVYSRLDMLRNENIRSELKVLQLVEKIDEHKNRWRQHVLRIERILYYRGLIFFRPHTRQQVFLGSIVGRARKRWSGFNSTKNICKQ